MWALLPVSRRRRALRARRQQKWLGPPMHAGPDHQHAPVRHSTPLEWASQEQSMRNRQPAIERKNLGTEAGLSKQLDIARNTTEVHFATVRESDGSNHQLLLRANHSVLPAGAGIVGFEQQDSVRIKSVSACLEYLELLF